MTGSANCASRRNASRQFCRYDIKGGYPRGEKDIAVSIASHMILLYITKALADRLDAPEPTTH